MPRCSSARASVSVSAPHALGDHADTEWTVIDGVHAGDDREQHLRRADVAGRAVTPDVLLARLERETVGGLPVAIDRQSSDAPRQQPLVRVRGGQEGGVRPAVAERHAEALRRADGDVRSELARRREQAEREQIGGNDHAHVRGVGAFAQGAVVRDAAAGAGIGDQKSKELGIAEGELSRVADHDLDTGRFGARAQHGERLRMHVAIDKEARLFLAADVMTHGHRLGRRRALVEQGCVGERQTRQIGDQRLEVHQGFQAALRDLGLVGRVLRIPAWVLQDVALNHRRGNRVVVARADERAKQAVLAGELGESLELFGLAHAPRAAPAVR